MQNRDSTRSRIAPATPGRATVIVLLAAMIGLPGAASLLPSARAAGAQPLGTDLIACDQLGNLLRVAPTGTTTIGNYAPSGRFAWDVALDLNDRDAIVSIAPIGLATGEMVSVDLASGVATTIVTGVGSVLTRLDENGDFIVSAMGRAVRISRTTAAITTLHTGRTVPFADRDVATGNWMIADLAQLLHLDPATGAIVKTLPLGTSGHLSFAACPGAPEAFAANFALHRIDTRTGATTALPPVIGLGTVGDQALAVDRAPDSAGHVLYHYANLGSAHYIQRVDRMGTVLGTVARFANQVTGIAFDRGRNLGALLNAPPNDRSVVVSFANAAGLFYTVLFSLAGSHPGVPLPDGRRIALNPDALTVLTLQGSLPPLIRNNVGRLSTTGRGGASLDLNRLGSAVHGLRLWAVAVVFDPSAPLGIAQISAPMVIVL